MLNNNIDVAVFNILLNKIKLAFTKLGMFTM